jgi:hypothetical protein
MTDPRTPANDAPADGPQPAALEARTAAVAELIEDIHSLLINTQPHFYEWAFSGGEKMSVSMHLSVKLKMDHIYTLSKTWENTAALLRYIYALEKELAQRD